MLDQLLFLVIGGLMVFLLYLQVRHNKAAFSKQNLNQSLGTLAKLALGLIAFVGFLVMLLK